MKIRSVNAAPTLCAVIFLLLLGSELVDTSKLGGTNPYLTVIIFELLIFAMPALFFCRLRGGGYSSTIRFRLFEPGSIPFILISTITLILSTCTIKLWINSALHYTPETGLIYHVFTPSAGYGDSVIFACLSFALFPAITEELVFRGIMLAEYEDCGVAAAVVLSSVLFTMLHFDLTLIPVYFISGVILAMTVYACRSVLASMVVHTANNIFTLFFEDYIWNSILQPRNIVIFSFLVTALTILSFALLFGEAGRLYKSYGVYNADSSYVRPKEKRTPAVYAVMTIPFAACLLIYILAVLL